MKTIKGKLLALLLIMVSVLFLASCKDKTYTLSFVSEHGNAPSAITVKKDEEINLRDSKYQLTAEGYVFKGWFFDAQKTNMALVFNLEEDTTVYAKWAKVNTVTFNSNGGSTVEPIKVESGSTIEAPSQPTKQGFKFAGWYKEATFTNKFNFENTEINNDITLYAKWNAVYTVTYNTNGGNEIEPTSVEVGKTYTLPEDPVKEGFRFAGWYTDEALQNAYVSTGEIGSNLTLFAKWTGNQYTVIYNANGGKGNMAQDAFVYGTSKQLAKNIFTKVGYKFVGWSLTATGEKDFNDEQIVLNLAKSGSVTVYALWEKVEYHVVFVPNYAEQKNTPEEIDDVVLKVGEQFDLTRTLADLDHYTFNKWTLDVDNVDAAYAIGSTFILSEEIITAYANQNNQVKLYGLWNPKKYSVEFVGGEGATGSMTSQEFTFGVAQALTHNAFEKEGFSFVGWTDQDNNEYTDGQQINVSKNLTLTAKWHDLVYTIRFNANGGTGTMSNQNTPVDEDTFTANVKLNANQFTKLGYVFAGWAIEAEGAKLYDDKANVVLTDNVELFALWTKANYTLKFNGNGGTTSTPMADIVGQIGDRANLTKNSFERAHYTFKGWALSATGEKVFNDEELMTLNETTIPAFDSNNTLTLYAVWEADTYEVTFNANGGQGEMSAQSFTYGVEKALTQNAFTRAGYRFLGWSLTANGTVLYLDQAEVSMEANVELFAVWEMVTKKVVVLPTNGYQAGSIANKLGEFTIQDTTNTCEDAGYVGQNINELMAAANYSSNGLTFIGFFKNFQATQAVTTETTYTSTDETIYVYAYFALTLSIDMSAVNEEDIFVNVYETKGIANSYNLYEYLPELKADSDKIAFYDKADLRNVSESLQVKAYSIPKWGADLTIQIDNSLDTYTITLEDSSVVYVTYLYQGTYNTTHTSVDVIYNEDKENLFDATNPKAFDVKAKKSGYSIAEIVGESLAVRLCQMFTFKMTSSLSAPNYAEYNGKDLTSTGSRWLNTTKEAYHVGSANIFKLRVNASDTNGTPITNINDVDIKYTIKLSDSASDLTKVFVDNITINNKKYSRAIGFKDSSDKIYLYVLNVVDTDNTYIAIQFTEEAIGKGFSIKVASKQGVTHEDDNFTIQVLVNSGVNVESHEELKAYYADLNVTEINIHKTIQAQLSADQYREKDGKYYVKNYEPLNQLYYAQQGLPTGDVYVRAVSNDSIINNHLVVNGNYFVIDGSGLPIIDDVNPEDGSALFPEDHAAVNKGQAWGSDENNKIWIKNSQTSIFANLLAYAETRYEQDAVDHPHRYERVDGNGYIVGTGAYSLTYRQYDNSVTYNNLYIISNTITPQVNYSQAAELVKSEEELAGYNSGGYNGIMVRGCTANTNNVVIDYANTGVNVSCDKATANCKDTYIFYSWGYSLYGWSSCTVNLENCDFRYSGGACVHIDEHRDERGHVEVYDYANHNRVFTIDFDPVINIDRKTQLINWVVGNEVWFRLMNLSATTAQLTAGMTGILHGYTNSQYSLVKSYNDLSPEDIAYSQGISSTAPDMWNFAIMLREGEFDKAATEGLYAAFDVNIAGQTIKREPTQVSTSSWVSYVTNSLRDELIEGTGLKGFMNGTKAQNPGLFVFPVSAMSGYVDSLKPVNETTLEAQAALVMGIYQAYMGMTDERSAIINMMASQAAGTAVEVPAEQQAFNAWSAYALGLSQNGILDHAGNSRGYGYLEVGLDVFGIRGTIYSYYYEG